MDDEAPPSVPEWVVTYGDMMSLLLTFFIMLVSLSEIAADKKYRAVIESLERYLGYRTSVKAPPGKHFPLNSMLERLLTVGSQYDRHEGYGGVKTAGPAGEDVVVRHLAAGTSVRVGEPIPFSRAGARLSPEAVRQLQAVKELLAGKPNKVELVGHVSPGPLPANAAVRDKTLLSYLRARAVFEFLKTHGVHEIRIRLRAAGDKEPLAETGDKRSRQHDRVEILILDRFAEHYIGPRESGNE